jgi:hypothetical protein
LSRCLLVLPEDAATGPRPHKAAKDPSLANLCGLSPATIKNVAALSTPTPRSSNSRIQLDARAQQPRCRQRCQRLAEHRLGVDQHGVKCLIILTGRVVDPVGLLGSSARGHPGDPRLVGVEHPPRRLRKFRAGCRIGRAPFVA